MAVEKILCKVMAVYFYGNFQAIHLMYLICPYFEVKLWHINFFFASNNTWKLSFNPLLLVCFDHKTGVGLEDFHFQHTH